MTSSTSVVAMDLSRAKMWGLITNPEALVLLDYLILAEAGVTVALYNPFSNLRPIQ